VTEHIKNSTAVFVSKIETCPTEREHLCIYIQNDGSVELLDVDNFTKFNIICHNPSILSSTDNTTINALVHSKENEHFWLTAEAILSLSNLSTSKDWTQSFWEMLSKAEPYGYAKLDQKIVRAHLPSN
jgi:hypothetical protein